LNVGITIVADAIQMVARQNSFHPVRDYLDCLNWDGTERVDSLLWFYAGTDITSYTVGAGRRCLVAAVARVLRPGCQADECIVLEGEQGLGKSQLVRALAGEEWFTDEISEFGSKDAAMQLTGKWIVELSELNALDRSSAARIKSFLSRRTDRFRPLYGRHVVEVPRQCIFMGTGNRSDYLEDETGARRFLPVKCGQKLYLEELARDRDQLWAEAVHLYRSGVPWWPEGDEVVHARLEQAARYIGDPWIEEVENYVRNRNQVTMSEVLDQLQVDLGHRSQGHYRRVGKILRVLGWDRDSDGQMARRNGFGGVKK
jgi:predicted P-loop ATPase